ncbi:hypothetical protein K432DRAFT_308866 [Lepidopterella palustris CBS 459.81]|uniref:Uncharacterized protein n=1 Tax=Lepidopterella palustris CBS 459.81 TaxID=1314670 RepID=A0A8E2E125_9PEZI|nr:hypothetical protein K432DRAFT_308866 [Lepidopterella palustris CBS 459.81]
MLPSVEAKEHLHEVWTHVLSSYLCAESTFWEEMVIAISSIARNLGELLHDNYCARLWKQTQLAWREGHNGVKLQFLLRLSKLRYIELLSSSWLRLQRRESGYSAFPPQATYLPLCWRPKFTLGALIAWSRFRWISSAAMHIQLGYRPICGSLSGAYQ